MLTITSYPWANIRVTGEPSLDVMSRPARSPLPAGPAPTEVLFSLYYSGSDKSVLALIQDAIGSTADSPSPRTPTIEECTSLLERLHALHPEATFRAIGPGYKLAINRTGWLDA